MRPAVVFVVPFIATLSGCDTIYGIVHRAELGVVEVQIHCAVEAAQSVPGVTEVSYRDEEGGRALTLTGIQRPEVIQRVSYTYNELFGNFYFRTNYRELTEYNHTYLQMHRQPPQDDIDAIRPAMLQIEEAIAKRCPTLQGVRDASENCMGVACAE